MKIGILGGTFDPPHLGHLIAATQIKERMAFDAMWLMPVASHAFEKTLSPAHHRLEMTRLVEREGILASDFEIQLGGISSTYHTMKYLREQHPDDIFYFCMGSDLLKDFHKWNDWQALVEENNIVIYPRGCDIEDLHQIVTQVMGSKRISRVTVIHGSDVIVTNISSTLIKKAIMEGASIEFIVPQKVISYITKHSLYL